MLKRIASIFFWLALTAYYFVALSFVSLRQREAVCTAVDVAILDSARIHFVTAAEIMRLVDNPQHKVRGVPMDSVRTDRIEARLLKVPPVRSVEAYKTADGTLHVDVCQRSPVLRVINRYGESFYLDENGQALRHNSRYSVHVLVANGYINRRMTDGKSFNVLETQAEDGKRDVLRELFDLAVWIEGDKFWKAQIKQLYVNADGDIELTPLVGAQIINFGEGNRIAEKFSMLKSLYRNGFNVKGWNTYDVINLKYEGQIICTKRQP
jgi:cell division protein FtsQ